MAKETKSDSKGKSNKSLVIILIIVAVVIGLVIVGRFIAQKVAGGILSRVTGQNVNITEGGNGVTVKTDKGDLVINSGGSLPSDFPSDFPVYSGAKLAGSFSAKGDDGGNSTGTSVVWETSDDATKVGTYYKSQLAAAGYTIVTEYSSAGSTTFTFEKGDISGFMGVTKGSDGKTAISVTLGTK